MLLFGLFATVAVAAQTSTWQGSCAVTTYGNLPPTGFYGASNSFAQNTLVTVTNPATNKSVTVLIIDRTQEAGLLLLVSQAAGSALGISGGQVAQVQVALAQTPAAQAASRLGDLPYSPDSDIYPAAGVGNPTSLQFLDKYLKSGQTPAAPPASGKASSPAPAIASSPPPTAQPAPAGPVPSGPSVSTLQAEHAPAQALPKLALAAAPEAPQERGAVPIVSRLEPAPAPPEGGLSLAAPTALPPVVDPGPALTQIASATPPPAAPIAPSVSAVPEPPAGQGIGPRYNTLAEVRPQTEGIASAVTDVPAVRMPGAAAAPQTGPMVSLLAPAAPPPGQVLAVTGLPAPSTEGLFPSVSGLASAPTPAESVRPVPAQPAPELAQAQPAPPAPPKAAASSEPAQPSAQPSPERAPAQAAAQPRGVVPGSQLKRAAYYLQLGAYTDPGSALSVADSLPPAYPVSVYAFTVNKKSLYKVMIGPLNQDESGTLLYLFTSQGFQGAFVRKAN